MLKIFNFFILILYPIKKFKFLKSNKKPVKDKVFILKANFMISLINLKYKICRILLFNLVGKKQNHKQVIKS